MITEVNKMWIIFKPVMTVLKDCPPSQFYGVYEIGDSA